MRSGMLFTLADCGPICCVFFVGGGSAAVADPALSIVEIACQAFEEVFGVAVDTEMMGELGCCGATIEDGHLTVH